MYSKVIVPLDGSELSEQALPYAQLVAQSLSVPIELVQAFDILPPGMLGTQSQSVIDQIVAGAQERAAVYLSSVRQRLEEQGHSVSASTVRGAPGDAIVTQAGTDPTALVVMSTHGRGGIARWVLGSVTDKVLHTIPNPMLIVRATVTGPASPQSSVRTVLVPLDGSPLAELSLAHAASVAAALTASISLLRITPTGDYYRYQLTASTPEMSVIPDFDPVSADELVDADADDVSAYLADVENRLAIDHAHGVATAHQTHQNVAQAIIDKASEQPSLIVMTTHGRSGVGRVVLGSVTDRVVRHSNSPVLVIR
jgi:nucleotide-binding universal stress UspA family protein